MRVTRNLSPATSAATAVVVSLMLLTAARAAQQDELLSKIKIKNFGCINETFYRGAQPKEDDYKDLAALGIKTVIDLQRVGERDEQRLVEAAGMKFYRIGMSDRKRPSLEQIELFLKIVNDPANQPVFVHCRGGRHRTGVVTAAYRMTREGWRPEQAIAEMKKFDFDRGFGHGALKDFVFDFHSYLEQKGVAVSTDQK
ncbi:MAG TPA: tyrosine-protein phosphatase [Blastocatellia bacterium]|nr:tyrosine-protein phosphatase [Blastocatellia bacterium]